MLLILAALLLAPDAGQLLDEAERALRSGNKALYHRKYAEAKAQMERDHEALSDRLRFHVVWDDCVKAQAARVARLPERLEVLADATLGLCERDEGAVQVRQRDVIKNISGLEGDAAEAELETVMAEWKESQRKTALAIIANARLKQDRP